MRAEIICIGSELLLGDIADTNTQYLAQRLSALGIDLYYSTSVGDNLERLLDCLRRAIDRSDLVLTTGGLGPTDDDVTRDAIAHLLGETPVVDDILADELQRFFRLRGMEMSTNNLKQATLIPSARPIRNTYGTAPGWWVTDGGHSIVAMPGPPGELRHMWETEVEPHLFDGDSIIQSRTLKLFDISESRVDELLKPLTSSANPTVAVYAKQDGIYVRITTKAASLKAALRAIAPVERQTRRILGAYIWGADDDTQESTVAAELLKRGLTIAVGETITGGSLTAMLSSAAESHIWFRGSLVLPADAARRTSAPALARQVATQFQPDLAIGICGTILPESDPPMGEVTIAILGPGSGTLTTATHRIRRHRLRTIGSYYALHELRGALVHAKNRNSATGYERSIREAT